MFAALRTARSPTRHHLRAMSSIPKTMKAVLIEAHGGPEANVLREVPVPQPKDGEVLIKVEWTGANYIDNYRRSGLYKVPLPHIMGQDVVGTIVGGARAGERVWTPVGSSFAEYVTAPEWKTAALPASVDPRDGVSMCTVALTSATLAREAYPVKKGDVVLIRAAAGGVGLVLTQLCKHIGATVIGTTSTAEKAALAKKNGADHLLLTTASSADNVKEIMRITNNKGVQGVFDGVGADTWEENFEVTAIGATIVTFGNASGPVPAFSPLKLSPKCLKVTRPTLFPWISTPESFKRFADEVSSLTEQGVLKYAVHKVYPFSAEGVAQTQIDISGRGTTGKLLVHVSDGK